MQSLVCGDCRSVDAGPHHDRVSSGWLGAQEDHRQVMGSMSTVLRLLAAVKTGHPIDLADLSEPLWKQPGA
jgi:hypothetical protein